MLRDGLMGFWLCVLMLIRRIFTYPMNRGIGRQYPAVRLLVRTFTPMQASHLYLETDEFVSFLDFIFCDSFWSSVTHFLGRLRITSRKKAFWAI